MTQELPVVAWFATTLGVKFTHVDKRRVTDWIGSDGDCDEPIIECPLTDHTAATAAIRGLQERVAELEGVIEFVLPMAAWVYYINIPDPKYW